MACCNFFQELNIAGINSLKIFLANTAKMYTRRQYLFELAMALMKENSKKRSELQSLPKDIEIFLLKYEIIQFLKLLRRKSDRFAIFADHIKITKLV